MAGSRDKGTLRGEMGMEVAEREEPPPAAAAEADATVALVAGGAAATTGCAMPLRRAAI
jgi:hypothetical protein